MGAALALAGTTTGEGARSKVKHALARSLYHIKTKVSNLAHAVS